MPPRGRPSAVSPGPRGRAGASPSPAPVKAVAKAAKKGGFFTRHGNVYVYVPNLIGYARVAAVAGAFAHAFSDPETALALYLAAFVCDELDGRFARKFNQCTTFGAVLDMVTDRLSTTGLCIILAVAYPAYALVFLALVALDIGAHWAQMYASLLSRAASHKDVAAAKWALLRAYYSKRIFMGMLCVGAEVFYMLLTLRGFNLRLRQSLLLLQSKKYRSWPATGVALPPAALAAAASVAPPQLLALLPRGELSAVQLLALLAVPFWALKQVTNVMQGQFAAERLVAADAKSA